MLLIRNKYLYRSARFTCMKNITLLSKGFKKYITLLVVLLAVKNAYAQNIQWLHSFTGSTFNYYALHTDNQGNTFQSAAFEDIIDFDPGPGVDTIVTNAANAGGGFITKTDSAGNHIWVKGFLNMHHYSVCEIEAVSTDANGNIYVVGIFNDSVDFDPGPAVYKMTTPGIGDLTFIVKLDASGNFLWAKKIAGETSCQVKAYALEIDAANDMVILGTYQDSVDFDPGAGTWYAYQPGGLTNTFVLKLDSNGDFVWVKTLRASAFYVNQHLAVGENNSIYFTGTTPLATLDIDPGAGSFYITKGRFLVKLDSSGNFLWGSGTKAGGLKLHVGKDWDLYTTSSFSDTVDIDPGPGILMAIGENDAFVSRSDQNGNLKWSKILVSVQGALGAGSQTITSDTNGGVVVAMPFNSPAVIDCDPDTGKYYLSGAPYWGNLVCHLDSAGNFVWAKRITASSSIHTAVDYNSNAELIISGTFGGIADIDYGPGIYTAGQQNLYSMYLMKYNYCGSNHYENYPGCDSVVLADTTYITSADYVAEYLDANNCDSNVIKHVAIFNQLTDHTIYGCDSVTFYGQVYTQSGTYSQIISNPYGCDSVHTVHAYISHYVADSLPNFLTLYKTLPVSSYLLRTSLVEVDSLYNIYVSGDWQDGDSVDFNPLGIPYVVPANGAFVSRYDSSGMLTWVNRFNTDLNTAFSKSLSLNDELQLNAIMDFPAPAIYIYGVPFTHLSVYEYNNLYSFNTTFNVPPFGFCYDLQQAVFEDPVSDKTIFMTSVCSGGTLVERKNNFVSDSLILNGNYYGKGIADSAGNIYLYATSIYPITKLDSNLNIIWQKNQTQGILIRDVQIDPSGHYIIIGGQFNGTRDFDFSLNTSNMTSNGNYDAFVAMYDTSLNFMWAKSFGDSLDDIVNTISFDQNGAIYAGGNFESDRIDLNPGNGIFMLNKDCYSTYGGYISKFSINGDFVNAIRNGSLVNELQFKSPDRIYATGVPFLRVYKAKKDTTIYSYVNICFGDSMVVGNSVYYQSGVYTDTLAADSIMVTTLIVHPLPAVTANASDTLICSGDSILLFGNGANTYTWNNLVTDSAMFSPAISNTYIVTGTDNYGCVNTDTVSVMVNALPIVIANASDTSLCMSDSVILFGSGAVAYTWNNLVIDSVIFSPPGSSYYLVSGTDSNGCTNIDSVEVIVNSLPTVVANASDTLICFGDSVLLFGSGAASYVWDNMVIDSVLFAPVATISYLVTGTDINGCINTDSIEVVVNALPSVIANASDTSLCMGDSVLLFGSGAVTYTWNNLVVNNILFSPVGTAYYLVAGTDTNGCVNTDSIDVIVNSLPVVVAAALDTSVCIGNPVILYGTGADSFSWTNMIIDSIAFYPIDTAMYVVTGIDSNGCMNQDSILITANQIPTPVLVFSGDTLYCTNVTGVNIYWFKDTVAVDSLVNYYVVTQNGNYEVLVVDTNGCVGADSISMLNIGYTSQSKSNIIRVFPNPTSNLLNISFDMYKAGEVELMINDLIGNKIYSTKKEVTVTGTQLLKIDLSQNNLNTGIYFLNIIMEGRRNVVKFEYQK